MSVLYKFQKDRIKDSIIKRVKVKKRRKYGLFPISRQVRKCEKFNSISYIVPLNPTDWDSQSGWAYDINVYALDGKNRFEFFRIKEDDAERIFKLIGVSEEVEASTTNASTSDSSIANAASTSTARDRAYFDSNTIKSTTPASKNGTDQKSRLEMLKKITSSRKIK